MTDSWLESNILHVYNQKEGLRVHCNVEVYNPYEYDEIPFDHVHIICGCII